MNLEEAYFAIKRCFGDADGIFANHPIEEQGAKELKQIIDSGSMDKKYALILALGYMEMESFRSDLKESETEKFKKYFGIS